MSQFNPGDLVETLVMSKGRGSKYWLPARVISQSSNRLFNLEIVGDIAQHYMVAKERKSVKPDKIRPPAKLHIGDEVRVDQNKKGKIRWIGCDKLFGNSIETRYGIELDEPRGFSDGTWKGKRFFRCNRWCGVFLKERERIRLVKSSQPNSSSTLVKKTTLQKLAQSKVKPLNNQIPKNGPSSLMPLAQYDEKESRSVSPRLHTEEEKEIRTTFKFFDTNKDRKIDAKELKSVMKKLGSEIDDAGVQLLLRDFDLNKSGTIEWDEFLKVMKQIGGLVS